MTLFTIGHSTHTTDRFLDLLATHRVQVVVDVRSTPFSRINPQFNQEDLKKNLNEVGIRYLFLGKELGARSNQESCYVDNKVQYRAIAETKLFQSGLERVMAGSEQYRVCLMCAEKEPLDCHRTILVANELQKRGVSVVHILANGDTESQESAIQRLSESLGFGARDLFMSEEEVKEQALKQQESRIAYVRST